MKTSGQSHALSSSLINFTDANLLRLIAGNALLISRAPAKVKFGGLTFLAARSSLLTRRCSRCEVEKHRHVRLGGKKGAHGG